MSSSEDPPVPYHTHLRSHYCGPACAQMVLAQIGVTFTGSSDLSIQDELYQENLDHTGFAAAYWTAPDGLTWSLNNNLPATSSKWFALFALDAEDLISRKIVWTIHHYQAAPVALVYGKMHWLVIRGYDASSPPTGAADTSYSINGFFVNDPDGTADEHIAYRAWQSGYMTGVPPGDHWSGKFVAVCDPEPPAGRVGAAPPRPPRPLRAALLPPTAAKDQAVAGLEAFGLYARESWKQALAGTKPGMPFLVQRLDRLDGFYYVVPMRIDQQTASVLVCVDARTGDYLQAMIVPEGRASPLARPNFVPNQALQEFIGQSILVGRRLGPLVIRKEAHGVYPVLVWKPCRESFSPYLPFSMVTVGDHRVYIRVDGQLFTQLHDRDGGL